MSADKYPPDDETKRLGFLLHDASRLLRKRFETSAAGYGLSSTQWHLLVRVWKEEGVAQARLAQLLEVEPISISRLVDRMEEGGWIERRFDPADRRVRSIHLTEKSRTIFDDMRGKAHEVYSVALAGMSVEECKALLNGLTRMIANLNDDDQQAAASKKDKAA